MLWQKYLTQILSLQTRGKHLEKSLNFSSLSDRQLLPSQLLRKLNTAKEAKVLYTRALRMSRLLEETQDDSNSADIGYIARTLEISVQHINHIIKMIDAKAAQFGIGEEKETPAMSDQMETFVGEDANMAEDGSRGLDGLKNELKHSLKALSDIVEYMERPTLLKIRKEIDKLVNY